MWITTAIAFIVAFILGYLLYRTRKQSKEITNQLEQCRVKSQRYAGIQNVEARTQELESQFNTLQSNYNSQKQLYDRLVAEISILQEESEMVEVGLYKPHFDFDSSETYKRQLENIRQQQKNMIKAKNAVVCTTAWVIEGDKRKGKQFADRNVKMMLRAFNNECDAAIGKVRWNNVEKMEARISKSYEALNKLGKPSAVNIEYPYLSLRLQELYLAHEYNRKKQEEKEEQRQIREQMREEARVEKEIEKAKKEAFQEEKRYQKALEQARKEMESAQGEELVAMQGKLALLEGKLIEARDMVGRAVSRAELTKSGHVYIISNIGSFGENVYKIGMTRRLNPDDRIRELGDASVPFRFDVHAMVYSDNAPALEKELHKRFGQRRVNLVNHRKEFFSVTLDEIESAAKEIHGNVEFVRLAEAAEFRESEVLRAEKSNTGTTNVFPDALPKSTPVLLKK